ncbi:MAG: DUF368 domain-containing protein [Phycisphaerales bacterium]|nr:DUF368 domain-containing protein [Phycisphaerales bacterium]
MTAVRCLIGGVLMGLANLVPGISGGTMLLACGVYRRFVDAVARVTTFRWSMQALAVLAVIATGAGAAILLGAGLVSELVIENRWGTFSVFLGLTLGGIPLVWSLVKPWRTSSIITCLIAVLAMALLAFAPASLGAQAGSNWVLLFIAGLLGGAAMVLPGLSGAYLLLILGQYVVILSSIEMLLEGGSMGEAMRVLVPVGCGAVVGIVGISNLMKWLLQRFPHGTHGFLLGLLAGAVFGLWPFYEYRTPDVGQVIRGQEVTQDWIDTPKNRKHWPTAVFSPSGGQVAGAFALGLIGFAGSVSIGRLGAREASGEGVTTKRN